MLDSIDESTNYTIKLPFLRELLPLQPHTRKFVSETLKNEYIRCLRRLTGIVQSDFAVSEALTLQGLLAEAQQILEELGHESN